MVWEGYGAQSPQPDPIVRLKAHTIREVKVLFKYTLSGLKPNVTASW